MLLMKFKIHVCKGFKSISHLNGLRMDLNARVDVNFARVDVNFQRAIVTKSTSDFFYFDINQHHGPTNTSYKILAKYTWPFWRKRRFY